jgi:coenzyme F420-reducing hydrogenase beta subunit
LRMRAKGSDTDVEGIPELKKQWGTVLEVWEGYASDPEIRFRGSSGGLCTALSLFCLEKEIGSGVVHIGSDPGRPWKTGCKEPEPHPPSSCRLRRTMRRKTVA